MGMETNQWCPDLWDRNGSNIKIIKLITELDWNNWIDKPNGLEYT